ncbi:hypothetical protein ACIF70_12940 [Actinacidiphila glaucinigra]|uniref:hypothetical protein n=1 Tax=Actinacidiphila glaucinigra TaxID=235986 RepID=UPI0037CB96D7
MTAATVSVSPPRIARFALARTVGLPGRREEGWEVPYGPLSVAVEGVFDLAFAAWLAAGATGTAPAARVGGTPGARGPSVLPR